MMLSDVRDYVESLGISENVYMGKLSDKPENPLVCTTASTREHTTRLSAVRIWKGTAKSGNNPGTLEPFTTRHGKSRYRAV